MLFHRRKGETAEFSLDIDRGWPRLMCVADKNGWNARTWLTRAQTIAAAKLLIDAAAAMPAHERPAGTLYCSLCGKSQHEVRKLIAGPSAGEGTVFICDECATLAVEIVKEG